MGRKEALKELQMVRNIGPVAAKELYSIGIRTPAQLRRASPEKLYEKLKRKKGGKLDRCVLYQFRGAKRNRPWWECKD